MEPSLKGLQRLASEGVQVIATYPNNDAGGKAITAKLSKINEMRICDLGTSFIGGYLYHGVCTSKKPKYRVACVGNSSSGIKERLFLVPDNQYW